MEHADIHSPTINIRSGGQAAPAPVSGDGATATASPTDTAAHVFQLMKTKEGIEEELKALGSVLDSHKVTMKTTLTTFDGYPRDDIDIAQIRTTRTRIIRLRNDYKDIMKQIEAGLHAHHAATAAASEKEAELAAAAAAERISSGSSLTSAVVTSTAEVTTPFAKINSVEPGSPAEEAGLKRGDYLKKFGGVNALNHDGLKALAKEVGVNDGVCYRTLVCCFGFCFKAFCYVSRQLAWTTGAAEDLFQRFSVSVFRVQVERNAQTELGLRLRLGVQRCWMTLNTEEFRLGM